MQHVMDSVYKVSSNNLIHYASPNGNVVAEVLQLDAAGLDEIPKSTLGKYVFALGQYLVMLQYNTNMINVEFMLASKSLEHKVNKALYEVDIPKVHSTVKAKRHYVIEAVEELSELQLQVDTKEAEKTIMAGMIGSVEGLLNALKKEMSSREFKG